MVPESSSQEPFPEPANVACSWEQGMVSSELGVSDFRIPHQALLLLSSKEALLFIFYASLETVPLPPHLRESQYGAHFLSEDVSRAQLPGKKRQRLHLGLMHLIHRRKATPFLLTCHVVPRQDGGAGQEHYSPECDNFGSHRLQGHPVSTSQAKIRCKKGTQRVTGQQHPKPVG